MLSANVNIVRIKNDYYLKGGVYKSRRLVVSKIKEKERKIFLLQANKDFKAGRLKKAARSYESFLKLSSEFDSNYPAFNNMIHCYVNLGILKE